MNDFIIRNYTVIEPDRFEPSGFRIYQIKDSTRRKPIELAGVQIEGQLGKPTVVGPQMVNTVPKQYLIEAAHSNQHLQRLEILVDGTVIDSVTFSPVQVKQARFTVPFDQLIPGDHKIEARATESSGASAYSDPCIVKNAPAVLPPDRLPEFGLQVTGSPLIPSSIIAPFGANGRMEAGRLVFFAHAPSTLIYPINIHHATLRGRFGFRDGAWATDNSRCTDGADFIIELIRPNGAREVYLQHALRPTTNPEDRGKQKFEFSLPSGAVGSLIFSIKNGPNDNPASDWTYWSDLLLVNSR